MPETIHLNVNGIDYHLAVDPETPLLYILRNELGLKSVRQGCEQEQCGACKVLIDNEAVPTCKLPVSQAARLPILTIEGLGSADNLHPLQEAFLEAGALQCGYCSSGMIFTNSLSFLQPSE